MGAYNFREQLAIGQRYEDRIDKWVTDNWGVDVIPVTMDLQRAGIDRIWKKQDGRCYTVEYKADIVGGKTGNIFLETLSNDKNGKGGWTFTSGAQLTSVYFPVTSVMYLLETMRLKDTLPEMITGRNAKKVRNEGYNAFGVPFSITDFAKRTEAKAYYLD